MALITCTECGKRFSDKAACCPECGCPTEVVMKESDSREVAVKRETTSREAEAAMLAEVASVREKAKQAEDLFDSRDRMIQRKASQDIDLFGGYATSRVVEIRADARRACDDLYTSYQTLAETLDGVCRPLLAANPGGKAIKAVADMMRFLNDESEIESNFTASFNGSSLGNVANSKYVPSIQNKMAQRFWESQYAATPYAAEFEKKKRQEAEEARQKREAERKRREEEKRAEEQRRAEQKARDKAHMEKIASETQVCVKDYRRALRSQADQHLQKLTEEMETNARDLQKRQKECRDRLEKLSILQFREKRELARELERVEYQLSGLTDPQTMAEEKARVEGIVAKAASEYEAAIEEHLAKRFPGSSYAGEAAVARKDKNEYSEEASLAKEGIPRMPDARAVLQSYVR
ncbi:MAG: hypothetical protein IKU11_06690 [Clostridia bacterium]|nr:hypothetical protein [Clostridia bacterium]